MVEFLQQVRSYEVSTISKEYVKRGSTRNSYIRFVSLEGIYVL